MNAAVKLDMCSSLESFYFCAYSLISRFCRLASFPSKQFLVLLIQQGKVVKSFPYSALGGNSFAKYFLLIVNGFFFYFPWRTRRTLILIWCEWSCLKMGSAVECLNVLFLFKGMYRYSEVIGCQSVWKLLVKYSPNFWTKFFP